MTIFSGDTLQQLISLLVFVALLAVGMSLDERVFTIWGAVGVATAVLWYLRGFTYILLALLALGTHWLCHLAAEPQEARQRETGAPAQASSRRHRTRGECRAERCMEGTAQAP